MPRLPSKFPLRIFFGGAYSTQAPTDVELGPRLSRMIASVMDPLLMSVRVAGISGTSALAVTETVPLTSVLPVMADLSTGCHRDCFKFQVSSFKFYLSHTRLYRDCITSSEMRVGSAPWTVQILKKQHKGSKHKIR